MSIRPVALVTGASRGIGLAIARQLAADGFDIVATGLEADDGGLIADLQRHGGSALYLSGDISDLDQHAVWLQAIAAGPGRVDCLVNNAGMGAVQRGDVLELSPANFDRILSVNLRGTLFLTQGVLKLMLSQPPGPVARSVCR